MRSSSRKAATLVLVLLMLGLAATLIVPLATLSGVEALETLHACEGLRHQLAVESLVPLLPSLIDNDEDLRKALERGAPARVQVDLGGIQLDVLVQDDSAKVPLPGLFGSRDAQLSAETLHRLGRLASLPPLALKPAPTLTGCLDDLFDSPTDSALFGRPDQPAAWASFLTVVGQRVHVWNASASVLEVWLDDLRPGLGRDIVQRRNESKDLGEVLHKLELEGDLRKQVEQRLTTKAERHSLLVRSTTQSSVRQRYLICDSGTPPRVLVNWEVAR